MRGGSPLEGGRVHFPILLLTEPQARHKAVLKVFGDRADGLLSTTLQGKLAPPGRED